MQAAPLPHPLEGQGGAALVVVVEITIPLQESYFQEHVPNLGGGCRVNAGIRMKPVNSQSITIPNYITTKIITAVRLGGFTIITRRRMILAS